MLLAIKTVWFMVMQHNQLNSGMGKMRNLYLFITLFCFFVSPLIQAELTVSDLEKIEERVSKSNKDLIDSVDKRFDDAQKHVDRRFDVIDDGIDNTLKHVNDRFDDTQKSIDRIF